MYVCVCICVNKDVSKYTCLMCPFFWWLLPIENGKKILGKLVRKFYYGILHILHVGSF